MVELCDRKPTVFTYQVHLIPAGCQVHLIPAGCQIWVVKVWCYFEQAKS